MVVTACLICPDYKQQAEDLGKPVVLTIPYSHFVDFARWSLRFAKVEHHEEALMPGQHILPVLSVRVASEEKHLSTTSSTDPTMRGKHATGVPVAVLPDGGVAVDSWSIATHVAKLSAPEPELRKFLDEELGPATRKFGYVNLLSDGMDESWTGLLLHGTSWWHRLRFHLGLGAVLRNFFTKLYDTNNPSTWEKSKAEVSAALAAADRFLLTRQGPFFGGDKPSAADLAFAALAAPAILPDQYCGGEFKKYFDGLLKEERLQAALEEFRATETGRFCLSLYSTQYIF